MAANILELFISNLLFDDCKPPKKQQQQLQKYASAQLRLGIVSFREHLSISCIINGSCTNKSSTNKHIKFLELVNKKFVYDLIFGKSARLPKAKKNS